MVLLEVLTISKQVGFDRPTMICSHVPESFACVFYPSGLYAANLLVAKLTFLRGEENFFNLVFKNVVLRF